MQTWISLSIHTVDVGWVIISQLHKNNANHINTSFQFHSHFQYLSHHQLSLYLPFYTPTKCNMNSTSSKTRSNLLILTATYAHVNFCLILHKSLTSSNIPTPGLRSSGLLLWVAGLLIPRNLKKHTAFIFKSLWVLSNQWHCYSGRKSEDLTPQHQQCLTSNLSLPYHFIYKQGTKNYVPILHCHHQSYPKMNFCYMMYHSQTLWS